MDDLRRFNARSNGNAISDNIAIAAGFGPDREAALVPVLLEWLKDRHPSFSGGYVLHLASPGEPVLLTSYFSTSPQKFKLRSSVRSINGRYGAHGPFLSAGLAFLDLASSATPLTVGRAEELPTDTEEARLGRTTLPEVIDEAQHAQFEKLYASALEDGLCQIVYRVPALSSLLILARKGGTGLLEDYPRHPDLRERAHKRNLAVVRNCKLAYDVYIKSYVQRVGALDPLAPNAEATLRALGPPESPYTFPRPAGVSRLG